MADHSLPHITVCICTFRRPEMLKTLLEDLGRQETKDEFSFSIVVADNDAAESARAVVEEFAGTSTVAVRYCVQTERGIAPTRNRAVELAVGEFIAFIDDDEFPGTQWLLTALRACRQYDVSGVLGPVLPFFPPQAPAWIVKGGLFDRPEHPTGMTLRWPQTRTGNVLLRRRLFTEEHYRFNPEFRSGSDQEFFRRSMTGGHVFVWCNEAVVYETVPPARWKRSFLIRRALFRGVYSFHNRRGSYKSVLFSLAMAPVYVAALPVVLLLGQARFMKHVFTLFYHLGTLLALAGINPIRDAYVTE